MPAISLIIPLYNAEKYLRPCLDSAKNQTFEDIEIICINDGSTDNTADIVNEYVAEDSRFRLIEQENAGCSMARNHGLKSAMSPYVALLDQDDVLHPQAMEVLHHLITKYNADVAEFVNETVPDDFVMSNPPHYDKSPLNFRRTRSISGFVIPAAVRCWFGTGFIRKMPSPVLNFRRISSPRKIRYSP